MSDFSTLNESSLHKTLKQLYAYKYNGKTEVENFGHIYDIVTENNEIIEIQTRNLKQLLPKITDTLNKNLKITVVHPVIKSKFIITQDAAGNIISKTKSPIKENQYDIFKELTGIYSILLHKNFILEIIEISVTEIRTKQNSPVQSKNNMRRYKKDWIKTNKKLNEIISTNQYKTREDYISFLPESLPLEFNSKDLSETLKLKKLCSSRVYKNVNLILWVLNKMNLIKFTKTEKRFKYYKISTDFYSEHTND